MPIYEYVCADCQHQFEELVLSSHEVVHCPSCDSTRLDRAMSVFASKSSGEFRSSSGGSCGNCSSGSCSSCSCH
jgi:putative FmdB family regulatory protein